MFLLVQPIAEQDQFIACFHTNATRFCHTFRFNAALVTSHETALFMSAQLNDSFSELSSSASPSGTIDASLNHGVLLNASKPVRGVKYLSYQPPGNGWSNQRVALENAVVLAKLLNRTLVVHPMAPHDKGALLKAGAQPGYIAFSSSQILFPYLFSLTSSYCPSSFLYKKWLHRIISFIMTLAS